MDKNNFNELLSAIHTLSREQVDKLIDELFRSQEKALGDIISDEELLVLNQIFKDI